MEFYSAVINPDNKEFGSIMEENDVVLYIKKDDNYSKSIAEMRSIGMVVRIRRNHIFTRYAAVMVVQGSKLNDLLKNIEPPQHNKWDPELIENNPEENKKAKKFRSQLISWVNDTIVGCCRSEVPDEVDLDGVSAYLPFDEDDPALGTEDKEDKSPDTINALGDMYRRTTHTKTVKLAAKKVKGHKKEEVTPTNETGGGKKPGSGGTADPHGPDKVKTPAPGDKQINLPKVVMQRIVQMPAPNTYRVALMLEDDCSVAHIAIKAIGDDGTKENVVIREYKIDRRTVKVNSEVAKLRDLKGNVAYEVFLYLEYSEKMLLELIIY